MVCESCGRKVSFVLDSAEKRINAMKRFKRWCLGIREVQTGTVEKTLPPIDVVMVWHTYLLNPMYVDSKPYARHAC